MSFEELIESKHPTAWIEFEEGRVDEVHLQLAGIHKIHLSFISIRRRYQFKSSVLRTRFYRLFRSSLFFFFRICVVCDRYAMILFDEFKGEIFNANLCWLFKM